MTAAQRDTRVWRVSRSGYGALILAVNPGVGDDEAIAFVFNTAVAEQIVAEHTAALRKQR